MKFGICCIQGCENPAVIVCRFQSLAIRDLGPPLVRYHHKVERAMCWPCFAVWTERLKTLSRQGWGLGD
jgi:hypothetical protein